jgi:hypothetical protein
MTKKLLLVCGGCEINGSVNQKIRMYWPRVTIIRKAAFNANEN